MNQIFLDRIASIYNETKRVLALSNEWQHESDIYSPKYAARKAKTILEQERSIEKSKYDCSVTFIVDCNERTGKSKQK